MAYFLHHLVSITSQVIIFTQRSDPSGVVSFASQAIEESEQSYGRSQTLFSISVGNVFSIYQPKWIHSVKGNIYVIMGKP